MQTKSHPLVSIITVNFNQAEMTCALLNSVKKLTYPNFEMIVVDNGSQENPSAKILTVFPSAKIIISKINLGFAGGNNLGIRESKGEYLFFVNNDTELSADVIEPLLMAFEKNKKAGVISPKIYYFEQPEIIQYAGYTPVNPCTARNATIGQFEKDRGQHDQPKPTPYAHGAAMMVKREAIDKAGMMPEFFFLYYEELDWCEQIRKAGFEIYYEPKAKVYHKESVSVGKLSPMKTFYLTRNRILFMRRNAGTLNLMLFALFLAFVTIPKNVLMYCLKGEFTLARSFLQGVIWNLFNKIPHPISARQIR
ncbi:MAG TPA: glycosyltransferase family 2 protein [Chitinophagales bacterium]|nr:glycosyltransferase family 2 protein [Chitinophagales bacterium]